MRIAYASDEFGGLTTTFIRNEILHFAKEHQVAYHCLDSRVNDFLGGKVQIFKNPFSTGKVETLWKHLRWRYDLDCDMQNGPFRKRLAEFTESFRPDLFHCHFAYEGLRITDNLPEKHAPVLLHFHGYDASQMLRKTSYVRKLKKLSTDQKVGAIFCSENIKRKLAGAGVHFPSGTVIRCGVDLEFFKSEGLIKRATVPTLLQISSFSEKKGHVYTLKAFAAYGKGMRLVLAGSGHLLEEMKKLAVALNIQDRVDFPGPVSPEQARILFQQAHAFIHPSITAANGDQEGIPTVMMEAMAMDLPVISTLHSGIPELVTHGENGILVNEKDVDELGNAIRSILEMKIPGRNREKIMREYNIIHHNEALTRLYHECIQHA